MRVIAGSLKGRTFDTPRGHRTHPMGDKVKGALFNALGDIEGLKVLDAYAGSAALAIEAVSRGAAKVVAVDLDAEAYKTMAANVQKLGLDNRVTVVRQNISTWAKVFNQEHFDLIFADPPYDSILPTALQLLANLVAPNGLLVLSWPQKENTITLTGLTELRSKKYAGARLVFYRREA